MPKYATELTQGQAFSRTAQDGGTSDTAQRAYKVVLLHPAEVFSPQSYTGTFIGSRHPTNLNLVCTSFDSKFEGDSRMVAIVTFSYQSYASVSASAGRADPKTVNPATRPANWSTDVSLTDVAGRPHQHRRGRRELEGADQSGRRPIRGRDQAGSDDNHSY